MTGFSSASRQRILSTPILYWRYTSPRFCYHTRQVNPCAKELLFLILANPLKQVLILHGTVCNTQSRRNNGIIRAIHANAIHSKKSKHNDIPMRLLPSTNAWLLISEKPILALFSSFVGYNSFSSKVANAPSSALSSRPISCTLSAPPVSSINS